MSVLVGVNSTIAYSRAASIFWIWSTKHNITPRLLIFANWQIQFAILRILWKRLESRIVQLTHHNMYPYLCTWCMLEKGKQNIEFYRHSNVDKCSLKLPNSWWHKGMLGYFFVKNCLINITILESQGLKRLIS